MCKEKRIVYLAGIGMGTKEGMTVQAKESLKGCDCMIGAKRLLEEVSDADCGMQDFTAGQKNWKKF